MKKEQPNIIFIFADQWRGDCLSLTGHPVVKTPNLDAIANQHGVVFNKAYSTCPSCVAARASAFTGLNPYNAGRIGYQDCIPWNYENMLAQVLSDNGYQTHCSGKTHFFPQRKHCGFHSTDSYESEQNFGGTYVNDYHEWLRDISGGEFDSEDHGLHCNSGAFARPSPMPEKYHNNTWTAGTAIKFMKKRDKTRPFFLNIAFHRPHPPIDPPQAYWDMYKDKEIPAPPIGDWSEYTDHPVDAIDPAHGRLPKDEYDVACRAYYAQIAHIDNQIGRVMRAVTKQGLNKNTWVVFTADHGEMLGDHNRFRKMYALEGSARIPMIVAPPLKDGDNGIKRTDAPVAIEDVYSTILDIANIAIPENRDGKSLLPFLKEEPKDWREFVHGEHSGWGAGRQFMTDGKEKYIWKTSTGKEYLFDLVNDPQELINLSDKPEAQERLKVWRDRMIAELANRVDGMSDGEKLIPLKGDDPAILPWAEVGIFNYKKEE